MAKAKAVKKVDKKTSVAIKVTGVANVPGAVMLRNTTMSNIVIFKGNSKLIIVPNSNSITVPANGSIPVDKTIFAQLSKRKIIAGYLDKKFLVVDNKKDLELSETVSKPEPPENLKPENVTGKEGDKTATVKTFKPETIQIPAGEPAKTE
ncbi:MAG TPA: hypothetical protein DDW84_00205 [Phycisphaerales bacterium]|nr:MAG: hypothetical protein A2Y13_01950 [Planctomycetes bacterium GWC2_45_44]HBG77259.1 hypothetical protein [Phycisphaerales bacterium]HBR19184.1 hypothetical protein [Phycisphaerales bacterium]